MSTRTDLSKIPSISGNNGYSLRCPEVKLNGHEAHCSYTVCQHTILAYKEKRLPATSFQSCAAAIAAGKCQALKMMVEEIRKDEQLYFIDMSSLIKEVEEQNDHARTLPGSETPRQLTVLFIARRKQNLLNPKPIPPIHWRRSLTCTRHSLKKQPKKTHENSRATDGG